jgi:hypothetical protein
VGAAAGDSWQAARAGVVALFGRGGQRRGELAEQWADQTAAEIEQAPEEQRPQVRERLAPVWQQRLADLVQEYPEVGEELRAWAQRLQAQLVRAENVVHAGQAACRYSWRMPPSRSRRRMSR